MDRIQFTFIEQILRIAAFTIGSYFLGDGLAENEEFQAAVGGLVAAVGFVWWAYREYRTKQASKDKIVV